MEYIEAKEIIHNAEKLGSIYGVECVKEMLNRLDNPQNKLKIIHIAGTNGKGSVLAFISTILKEAGYRVGRYISPTLITYLERFQINEEYMSETEFANVMEKVKPVYDEVCALGYTPTAFEIETVMAFTYFFESECDFMVLETGLGGLYDATNVADNPLCCVFTSIGFDHMGILGNTLSDIATVKSGIIKKGTYVISSVQDLEVEKVLINRCKEVGASIIFADSKKIASDIHYTPGNTTFRYNKEHLISLSLNGTYQIINACTAISCIEVLIKMGYNVKNIDIINGIAHTKWFGRLSLIGNNPEFYVDGAHNEPAALELANSVRELFTKEYVADRKIVFIMGVFSDKDYNRIIDIMLPYPDKIFTIATPDNPRALPAENLAECINAKRNIATACASLQEAVNAAVEYNGGESLILAFGSLSHLNSIRASYIEYMKK